MMLLLVVDVISYFVQFETSKYSRCKEFLILFKPDHTAWLQILMNGIWEKLMAEALFLLTTG